MCVHVVDMSTQEGEDGRGREQCSDDVEKR